MSEDSTSLLADLRHHLLGRHPEDKVWFGPPDAADFHVAGCSDCWERWVAHGHRVSDSYINGMREFGLDVGRIERANAAYEAKRARYEELHSTLTSRDALPGLGDDAA